MKKTKDPAKSHPLPATHSEYSTAMSGIEAICARAAYRMAYDGLYGSSSKAISALLRKSEAKGLDEVHLRSALILSLEILQSHICAVQKYMQDNRIASRSGLSRDQCAAAAKEVTAVVGREYPENMGTVDYFTAMTWHMPNMR